MLSSTHAIFRGLQQHLKKTIAGLPASADPALKDGLVQAHRKLSDYFTKFDQSRYCGWAARQSFILLIVNPRPHYHSISPRSSHLV